MPAEISGYGMLPADFFDIFHVNEQLFDRKTRMVGMKCPPGAYLLLPLLGEQMDDASLSFASRPSHTLDLTNARRVGIIADDQVHLSNVQSFLAHACRHQHVEFARL
jgi:hypothetical protein